MPLKVIKTVKRGPFLSRLKAQSMLQIRKGLPESS